MDTLHNWALWRLLIISLIAFPFLVAALAAGFRRRVEDAASADARSEDGTGSQAVAGPGAWLVDGEGCIERSPIDAAVVVEPRAA
jgi:sarcosine oxidase gamma subunit